MKCARRNCRRPTRRLAKAMTVLTSVQGRSECPPLYARRNQPLSSPWFPCKIAHVRARRAVTDMKLPLRASMRQRRLDGDGPSCPLNESGCAKPRFVVKRPLVYTDIAPISAQQRQPHRPQAGPPPQLRGARWSRRYSTSSRRAPKCEPQSQMYVLKRRVIQNWLGRVVVGINEGRHELDAAASLSDCDCRTVAARLVK